MLVTTTEFGFMKSGEIYVTLEAAKKLKEAGFDSTVMARYEKNSDGEYEIKVETEAKNWNEKEGDDVISCPSLYYAVFWCRMNGFFYITTEFEEDMQRFLFNIKRLDTGASTDSFDLEDDEIESTYSTPEEAMDVAIKVVTSKYM